MQLNPAARELILKIVYYGPGMAGKGSNFQWLRDHAPTGTAGELQTLDIHSERTINFDLLAVDLGQVQGHSVRFEFHTVPGQSYYAATRRQLLVGADGIVFVADSRREALDENIASMNEMLDNLRQLDLPQSLPVVLQYNKQDLSTALAPEQLDPLMNVRAWPRIATVATTGQGIDETAQTIMRLLVDAASRASLPEVAASPEPRSWLISCHRCQAMLEVPQAAPGMIYTCGVCQSTLEVVDPDRGLTRDPASATSPLPRANSPMPQAPPPMPSQPVEEASDYAMKTLPVAQDVSTLESALQPAAQPESRPRPMGLDPSSFPLPGWEVLSLIDESPQGRRLRVRESASGRVCRALVVSQALLSQPGYADGLEPFVRLAGPLKHPHILPLLEMRPTENGVVLLSADAPDFENLGVVLGRRRALAPPHAMGILRQVVLALEDAARQGVVHGWLRPEVILVNPEGQVLVDEFALPKSQRFLVRELAGASAATEYYLAPEHIGEDARHDLRSDMFQVGALLYRTITGEGLVTGYNAHEALHRLMATGGKPLRAVDNNVSRELDSFYKKLTALNRSERFDGYRQLVEVLDRFGGGAKRQTLRLTQPVAAPGARHSPAGPLAAPRGAHRTSSANVGSGSGGYRRTNTGAQVAPPAQRTSGGGGWAAAVIVLSVLAVAGVAAFVIYQQRQNQPAAPTPAPRPEERQTRLLDQPPAPARPATATAIVQTAPPPVAPGSVPTPAQSAAAPTPGKELDPVTRIEMLKEIAGDVLAERWQHALTIADRLPAEDRQMQYQQISGKREARRKALEQLAANTSLAELRLALKPALDGTWGTGDDRIWAQSLLDTAATRPGAQATAATVTVTTAPAAPPAAAPTPSPAAPATDIPAAPPAPAVTETTAAPAVADDANALVAAQVLRALASRQVQLAQTASAQIPVDSPDGHTLQLLVMQAPRLAQVIDRVAKAGTPKLRLKHPLTGELCDLSAAAPSGVEVTSPTGATSALGWNQIGDKEIARLAFEAGAASGLPPADHQAAVCGLLSLGEDTLAAAHLRRSRAQLPAEGVTDLESAIALTRRAIFASLVNQADIARKANNAKALGDALVELRKLDRSVHPALATVLPRLEQTLKDIQEGRLTVSVPLRDRVGFDSAEDLQQFPDLTGSWQVSAGSAVNTSDNARLGRRDAHNVRTAQAILTPSANRGVVQVDFKGLRLVFDLAGGTFTSTPAGGQPSSPKPAQIVDRIPNTLYLEYHDDGNHTTIDLNGQIVGDVVMGDLGEIFAIATAGGAVLQIDEVTLQRANTASPGRTLIRDLGWEPAGETALVKGTGIVLKSAPGEPAGISRPIPSGIVGYAFGVRGTGSLRVQVSIKGGKWAQVEVRLTANEAATLTVRWSGQKLEVQDGGGTVIGSQNLASEPTNISLTATQQAVLVLPFKPVRQ